MSDQPGNITDHGIPQAVYLDTDVLRRAGERLDGAWLGELRELASELRIPLYLPQLVVDEWLEYLEGRVTVAVQRVPADITVVEGLLGIGPLLTGDELPAKMPSDFSIRQTERLLAAGFQIIPNADLCLDSLLRDAVRKVPPFDGKGRGFRDAVILETIAEHSPTLSDRPHIIVASQDTLVRQGLNRITDRGVAVTAVTEKDAVSTIEATLDEAARALRQQEAALLLSFLQSRRDEIFEFVLRSPITFSYHFFHGLYQEPDELKGGSVLEVVKATPLDITSVRPGAELPEKEVPENRRSFWCRVELALELKVEFHSQPGDFSSLFEGPKVEVGLISPESPARVDRPLGYIEPVIQQVSVKRDVTVAGSVDAEKMDKGTPADLQLYHVW